MLKEYKDILQIDNWEKLINDFKFNCFRYEYSKLDFYYYIFSCEFNDELQLKKYYSLINEHIALDFQTTLKKDVERWNIYIYYFVNDVVSPEIKYSIEQDKYATRKNVIDTKYLIEFENIDSKKQIIDENLFTMKRFPHRSENEKTLNEIINEKDSYLNKLIHEFNFQRKKNRNQSKTFLEKNLKLYLEVK